RFPALPLFLGYFGARNSKLFTHSHKFRQRLRLHFLHHLTSMNFDGDLTGAELGGDLFVEQARDHQPHHLALARRQRLVALKQLGTSDRGRFKNCCAEAKLSTRNPTDRIRLPKPSRTDTSSSTTKTIALFSAMVTSHC